VTDRAVTDPTELAPEAANDGMVTWIDIQGTGDVTVLRQLGERFGLHPLALEDVVNAPQRPKIEDYNHHVLIITRMVRLDDAGELVLEQVGLVVGPDYVLSFQEQYGDVLDPVRVRIGEGLGPIRSAGADYLAYALLDTIIDGYYPVLEEISEALARLETRVLARPGRRSLDAINRLKGQIIAVRRGAWPQREALNRLLRDGSRFISPDVRVYLRDTYDHAAQAVDVLDSHRELVNGLLSIHLSAASNRTNEVMKVLTIMASIFIPLTFLAGVYGMNFEMMPELHTPWGYPALLGAMFLLALLMLFYFRRKRWIGDDSDAEDDE
jgi:magnesium transporter